jgi:excisionase family DNA binding protein
MPADVQKTLLHVVDALQRGAAVSATPQAGMLTTQQAADLLNVSRPTVVKLLDGKRIPFEMAGTHRRIRLADVLSFRDARRREQLEALAAISSLGVDDEAELETTLASLRVARKAVRQARSSNE